MWSATGDTSLPTPSVGESESWGLFSVWRQQHFLLNLVMGTIFERASWGEGGDGELKVGTPGRLDCWYHFLAISRTALCLVELKVGTKRQWAETRVWCSPARADSNSWCLGLSSSTGNRSTALGVCRQAQGGGKKKWILKFGRCYNESFSLQCLASKATCCFRSVWLWICCPILPLSLSSTSTTNHVG